MRIHFLFEMLLLKLVLLKYCTYTIKIEHIFKFKYLEVKLTSFLNKTPKRGRSLMCTKSQICTKTLSHERSFLHKETFLQEDFFAWHQFRTETLLQRLKKIFCINLIHYYFSLNHYFLFPLPSIDNVFSFVFVYL